MRDWGARQWATATAGTALTLLVLGLSAVLIPNGVFAREIDPTWWSYPVWAATAVLSGLLLATYIRPVPEGSEGPGGRRGLGGSLLAWFAIGCPVCNKIVLLALGSSGAMAWFAPVQPLLAAAGLVLLTVALRARLRANASCPLPAAARP
ncbi:hypothetical protein [Nocardiopsis ganjiahuensis]|uniref:hypothetical protein n=1 Tax=Nocardiopsis ganjiahuensis TaxID=239984 RepID=UPI00034DCEA0|nr:hypothetical protein [Nocardiopsis ganjiahuensis]